jgi:hypothetical protein
MNGPVILVYWGAGINPMGNVMMRPAISDEMRAFFDQADMARENHGLIFQAPVLDSIEEPLSLADLRDLAMMQDLFYATKFVSHRKILGPLIVFIKERIVKALDPFLRRRLTRQFEINQFTWNMAKIIRQQNEQIVALKTRIEKLEARSSR